MKLVTILAAIMAITSAGQIYNNPPLAHFDHNQQQNYQPQDFTSQNYQIGHPEQHRQIIPSQSEHAVPQQYIFGQLQSGSSQPEINVQPHAVNAPSHNFVGQPAMPFHYADFGQNQYPQHFADDSFQGLQHNQVASQAPNNMGQSKDGGARILTYQFDHDGHNYQYAYETENGIKAQEAGSAIKGTIASGGYSYTGDDGQVYSVTYTADENGFKATGAHLPTPPPIPKEIAEALEKNARDEANGINDDGQYVQKKQDGQEYQQDEQKYHTNDIRRSTPAMSDSH